MILSPDQERASAEVRRFVRDPRPERQWMTVFGLAGTGKTTLMGYLVRSGALGDAILAAPTGKAAAVLRHKVGVDVRTIHQVIYLFTGMVEDKEEPGRMEPTFTPAEADLTGRLVVIDEASMVGRALAEELLRTGARVVATGDPGQLPPVKDSQFFTEANATLTEIHRQALSSPIIRQAHRVRAGLAYEPDGDAFRVVERATREDVLGHDAVLCWRNRTRLRLNARKRELLGLPVDRLIVGEPVMCLRNDHRLDIYNGATYEMSAPYGEDARSFYLRDGDREIFVDRPTVEGFDPRYEERRYDDRFAPFASAYAITVHKSQGSEWPSVLLFDECPGDRAFAYTGITRAAERATVVRWL